MESRFENGTFWLLLGTNAAAHVSGDHCILIAMNISLYTITVDPGNFEFRN